MAVPLWDAPILLQALSLNRHLCCVSLKAVVVLQDSCLNHRSRALSFGQQADIRSYRALVQKGHTNPNQVPQLTTTFIANLIHFDLPIYVGYC